MRKTKDCASHEHCYIINLWLYFIIYRLATHTTCRTPLATDYFTSKSVEISRVAEADKWAASQKLTVQPATTKILSPSNQQPPQKPSPHNLRPISSAPLHVPWFLVKFERQFVAFIVVAEGNIFRTVSLPFRPAFKTWRCPSHPTYCLTVCPMSLCLQVDQFQHHNEPPTQIYRHTHRYPMERISLS